LGSPSPPPAIQDKPLCAISESRRPLRKSERHPGNARFIELLARHGVKPSCRGVALIAVA
jgi:hypothetical protein